MPEIRESLIYALEKYPEKVEMASLDEMVLESARRNDRRPAYVKVGLPDEVVKSLRGPASKRRDLLLLVRIPVEVLERSESRIILPGEFK